MTLGTDFLQPTCLAVVSAVTFEVWKTLAKNWISFLLLRFDFLQVSNYFLFWLFLVLAALGIYLLDNTPTGAKPKSGFE